MELFIQEEVIPAGAMVHFYAETPEIHIFSLFCDQYVNS
jgi:hypothetical protein